MDNEGRTGGCTFQGQSETILVGAWLLSHCISNEHRKRYVVSFLLVRKKAAKLDSASLELVEALLLMA